MYTSDDNHLYAFVYTFISICLCTSIDATSAQYVY